MKYQGNGLPPDGNKKNRFSYFADDGLRDTVNMALELEYPLLVKGPPGCGKTRLADSIAHELGIPKERQFKWYIKSTSRARDGIYTIDMVRRLQDAQTTGPQSERAQRLTPYIRFGPLGSALKSPQRSLLLIDEIDKADIDFPNDLLRELDEMQFTIEELVGLTLTPEEKAAGWQDTYPAQQRPIIVITSNDEKELPDAFLRRCLFYYIDFPKPDRLQQIVAANLRDKGEANPQTKLIEHAIAQLQKFRAIGELRKAPATSELIDWVRILHRWNVVVEQLAADKRLSDLPHWQVLFKHERDVNRVHEFTQEQTKPK
ncbi:MAG TPA: MoxR family ATPase [Blastocatellia bacterium]|nr:MoxR family ATPase [Blastocatellia bacterium]